MSMRINLGLEFPFDLTERQNQRMSMRIDLGLAFPFDLTERQNQRIFVLREGGAVRQRQADKDNQCDLVHLA